MGDAMRWGKVTPGRAQQGDSDLSLPRMGCVLCRTEILAGAAG